MTRTDRAELDPRDVEGITATAHDYFDGYFDGDPARMARALHRDLVKRSPGPDPATSLPFISAAEMIGWTRDGEGVELAAGLPDHSLEVEVLDVHRDIASALVRSAPFHEYLHLVRTDDGWRIANTLYCRT
ncbi:MAG TPA: nuclear transport factor 2 family protein [Candidatus Nanopelagicales bacterium]|nr:nuclear transport factor 2 family protein [Candidatus Nanopelagicales bacterium]